MGRGYCVTWYDGARRPGAEERGPVTVTPHLATYPVDCCVTSLLALYISLCSLSHRQCHVSHLFEMLCCLVCTCMTPAGGEKLVTSCCDVLDPSRPHGRPRGRTSPTWMPRWRVAHRPQRTAPRTIVIRIHRNHGRQPNHSRQRGIF